jgi:hypothetical protein
MPYLEQSASNLFGDQMSGMFNQKKSQLFNIDEEEQFFLKNNVSLKNNGFSTGNFNQSYYYNYIASSENNPMLLSNGPWMNQSEQKIETKEEVDEKTAVFLGKFLLFYYI